MKKLCVALSAVALAIAANAATVKWNASGVYEVGSTTAMAGSSYAAYFVSSADLARDAMLAANVKDGNIDLSFLATTSSATGYSNVFRDNTTTGAGLGASQGGTLTTSAGNSESWTGYIIIVDSTDYTTAQHAYVTAEVTKATGASGQAATLAFNSNTGTQTAGNWYGAVPEPTSGLLFLLGVAGLALKRRRA